MSSSRLFSTDTSDTAHCDQSFALLVSFSCLNVFSVQSRFQTHLFLPLHLLNNSTNTTSYSQSFVPSVSMVNSSSLNSFNPTLQIFNQIQTTVSPFLTNNAILHLKTFLVWYISNFSFIFQINLV